jgi:hypothetical protein
MKYLAILLKIEKKYIKTFRSTWKIQFSLEYFECNLQKERPILNYKCQNSQELLPPKLRYRISQRQTPEKPNVLFACQEI